jgi:FkbM family methyltransferase
MGEIRRPSLLESVHISASARIRSAVNKVLAPAGFVLAQTHELASAVEDRWTMAAALSRAATLGVQPASIIDVGAAVGEWSQLAHVVFPDAQYVLVEPLHERAAALAALCGRHPRMRHVAAAAGETLGQVTFDVSGDLDGSGIYGGTSEGRERVVPMATVDAIVREECLLPPFLLKLDTHGYELPILAGAAETFAHTALLVIEVYNFSISPTAVPFWELCTTLAARGFRPADLCGLMRRPRDGLFWQAGIFSCPQSIPISSMCGIANDSAVDQSCYAKPELWQISPPRVGIGG